jgi:hypothetical protein
VWRSSIEPILSAEVENGEDVGDEETLVDDDDDDDTSCVDDGVADGTGLGKRKGTLRFIIRSRAFV